MTFWLALVLVATGQECQEAEAVARLAYSERRYDQAAVQFARALRACGPSGQLFLALAQAQLLAQRPADALASLDRIPAEDQGYVQALKVRAKAQYLLGRDADAEATLKRAATGAPGDAEVPYDLGRIYYQQGRHSEAAELLRRATALDHHAYKAWDNLGLASEALGDVEQAQQHYLKAIALVHRDHPSYDVVYANFADLLIKLGNYQRAFDLAAEAAQRNPDEPRNFFLAGKAIVQLGRSDLSVRWFEQAIALNADYPEPHYLLSQTYRRLGRPADAERALKSFQAAAARAPKKRR
ncbi:MAG: tetratricopeptide repeat protein [Acidobacteriota bacterium]|nr:tetratricopeptide repeat protein [Acidobacteriota bacterium]